MGSTLAGDARRFLNPTGCAQALPHVQVGALADFGVPFSTRNHPSEGKLEYSTADAVTLVVKAQSDLGIPGAGLGRLDAGVEITFGSENAVFLRCQRCTTTSIEDQFELRARLLELFKLGRWENQQVVVTEVVQCERATILASSARRARIELSTDSDTASPIGDFFSATAGLRAVKSENMALSIVAERELTPLFRALGVKRSLVSRRTKVVQRGGATDHAGESSGISPVYFDDVDYEYYA